MSASGSNLVFNVAMWMMVGASAMFAVSRISSLQHIQPAAAQRAAVVPEPESGAAVSPPPSDSIELRADGAGHFRSSIEVNGRSMAALVDTGATMVALTYEDAERSGIFLHDRDFVGRTQTANGTARFAPILLDRVTIGTITVRNVEAGVAERGALSINLLGMSFLGRLRRFEVASGRLSLQ